MAQWIGSPNYTQGRGGKGVEFIVCHWIVGEVSAADAVFTSTARQASAHYAVGDGVIHQYVNEGDTAWHAGNFDVNQRSIGIEHRGGPNLPISDATYNTSADLIADICRRYGKRFPLRAHREFFATACPGTLDLGRINQLVDQRLNQGDIMNAEQVKDLYRQLLGREAEPGGLATYTGKPWAAVYYAIKDSAEGQAYTKAKAKQLQDLKDQIASQQAQIDKLNKQITDLGNKPVAPAVVPQATIDQVAETNGIVKQILAFLHKIFIGG